MVRTFALINILPDSGSNLSVLLTDEVELEQS